MKTTGVRMAVQKIEINIFYYNCGFLGCQLALAERDTARKLQASRVAGVTRKGRRVHLQRCAGSRPLACQRNDSMSENAA